MWNNWHTFKKIKKKKQYNVMAVTALAYDSESRTKKKHKTVSKAEICRIFVFKRMQKSDKIRNETIRSDLNIFLD